MGQSSEHWLRRPATIKKLWRWGLALLVVIALLDIAVHGHAYFEIDGLFGFYSLYGLMACIAMVVIAKILGIFLYSFGVEKTIGDISDDVE